MFVIYMVIVIVDCENFFVISSDVLEGLGPALSQRLVVRLDETRGLAQGITTLSKVIQVTCAQTDRLRCDQLFCTFKYFLIFVELLGVFLRVVIL